MFKIPLPCLTFFKKRWQRCPSRTDKDLGYWIPAFAGMTRVAKVTSFAGLSVFAIVFLFTSCVHRENKPDFTWPVKEPHNLSRKFSVYHEGIDFPKRTGESVFSTAKGKVIYAGNQFSGYGKVIIIEHEYNWASLYAHLSKILVKTGRLVEKKEKIGEVGSTGRSSSPHLHFELIYEKQPVNPVPHLP